MMREKFLRSLVVWINILGVAGATSVNRSCSWTIVGSGEEITVNLTVDITGNEDYYGIDELIPNGYSVKDSGGGAIEHVGHIKWVVISGATDIVYTYVITSPTIQGTTQFTGYYAFEGDTAEKLIGGQSTLIKALTISGNAGVDGVMMNGLPDNPITNGEGYYTSSVSYGWSGTVTPEKTGYSFVPPSRTYNSITSDQLDQNYTAQVIQADYEVINLTQLTDGPIQESGPTFNADGTKIAYRNLHEPYSWDNCDIWVMNVDGSGKTQITTDSRGEFGPSFVPDGRITYTKEFGSNDYDIWMVNADGSNPHSFISGSYRQTSCRWHPIGNKLVYCSEYQWAGPSEIWTANADGTGRTPLTDHTVDGYGQACPVYSRSGNPIAYANRAKDGEQAHIWIMNADGSAKQQITFGAADQNPMFWWPDDSSIGYTQNGELWLHNLNTGADDLLLSVSGGDIGWADLSADGSRLVFDLSDASGTHIWIGDVTVIHPDISTIGDFCGPPGSPEPDGYVDYWDLLYFAQRWHTRLGDPDWDSRCDLAKEDNYVDYWDLLVFAQQWHKGDPP